MKHLTYKIVRVGTRWRWQALGAAGVTLYYSANEFGSPGGAGDDVARVATLNRGLPVTFSLPAVGKAVSLGGGVQVWRRS